MIDGNPEIWDVLQYYTNMLCKWPESAEWPVDSLSDITLQECI